MTRAYTVFAITLAGKPQVAGIGVQLGFQSQHFYGVPNMGEGTSEIRILFVFDPWRSAILLVAGDKARKWNRWYAAAIPRAEQLYEVCLKERAEEESAR